MQKRKQDIETLLMSCEKEIPGIQNAYEASLYDQKISPELQVKIKNYFENLRSVLDYIACDIYDSFCGGGDPKARVYFPIFSTREKFESSVKQRFPNLQSTAIDLYAYLEGIQPYHTPYKWLGDFGEITILNKHRNLVPQVRREAKQVRVTTPTGSVSWTPGSVRFGSGVFIGGVPVDPRTQLPVPHPSQRVERVVWVDFLFEGLNASALGLARQALIGVKKIAGDIDKWL